MSRLCWLMSLLLAVNVGCVEDSGGTTDTTATSTDGPASASKVIVIDGSSTVEPISSRMAEAFSDLVKGAKVNVMAPSGTGGGFKKFVVGETDINDASRPIKESEIRKCQDNAIEFLELKVAIDGISVVVNIENDWCDALTVAQLKKLWEPGSKVTKWNELDSSWPDKKIKLYGPDADSGTFDYFTEEICGESKASRANYEPSSNDNILVTGVSGDKFALGYFGFAYYVRSKDKLRCVAISATDDVADAVKPTAATIEAGEYVPLSRPLFIYVNQARLSDKTMKAFLKYYLGDGQSLVEDAGYVRLSSVLLDESVSRLNGALK
jgi:phosphate transport system substrate-binding protein